MEFDNKLLLIISIASLIFTNSFSGFHFSPSSSQENEIADELKETFGPIFDEAKEALSPDSSLDLDKVEEAFSPSLDEAKDAFGPISSWDEAKEAFGPVSSTIVDDAKKALSPSTLDDAKETFGPASSKVLDKAKTELDSIASWISQNKEDISFEAQNEFGLIPSPKLDKANKKISFPNNEAGEAPIPILPLASYQLLDEDKQQLGSSGSFITQNKDDISSLLEQALDEFGSISSSDLNKAKKALPPISPSTLDRVNDSLGPTSSHDVVADKVKDALPPISPSTLDEAKDALGPIPLETKQKFDSIVSFISQNKEEIAYDSSSILTEAQKELGPITYSDLDVSSLISSNEAFAPVSPSTLDEAKETIRPRSSTLLDDSKENVSSHTSLISQNKEEVSSDSPSISVESPKELGPSSSLDENAPSSSLSPTPAPISPSTLDEAKHVIGSYSSKAIDAAKEQFGSISSLFSQNKVELTSKSDIHHPHSLAIYFDQDTALAIESLIMKGQSNSHLAIEETKKLLSDITIASSESGKCMQKCMKNYESCIGNLIKAMEDLNGRNADLLIDDVNAVDGEISACQKCFLDNRETQSPLKDLEDAIIKAAHECLNVLDHSD